MCECAAELIMILSNKVIHGSIGLWLKKNECMSIGSNYRWMWGGRILIPERYRGGSLRSSFTATVTILSLLLIDK
ncbi:hypothetical protein Pint_01032 [Pistacia integerrima]|uniref:Uncharacterized protein n=1 Tax=Pistacia integerrima TaxID=434235 RepID=A0ACC0ZRN5_9ROSI|nr:hypothetical protein Pint_01032 [Pistacia integerrima]